MELRRPCARAPVAGVLACAALAACWVASPGPLRAQPAVRAHYVDQGSFPLPGDDRPGDPGEPTDVAVAPDGTLHLTDRSGAVHVYGVSGNFLRSYGGGILLRPLRIAIDEGGVSYVLDEGQKRVLIFGPEGRALAQVIGAGGSGAGRLSRPVDLALGPAGYVYVLDRDQRNVQIFSRDGTFVRAVPTTFGGFGEDPRSLAIGRDGAIHVADRGARSVLVFAPFPEIAPAGAPPRSRIEFPADALEEPAGLAVMPRGTVVLADRRGHRLLASTSSGSEASAAPDRLYGGTGGGRGSFRGITALARAGEADLVILDSELRKVERIRLEGEGEGEIEPERDAFRYPIRVTGQGQPLDAPLWAVPHRDDGSPLLVLGTDEGTLRIVSAAENRYVTAYGDSAVSYTPDPQGAFRLDLTEVLESVGGVALNDTLVVVTDPDGDRLNLYARENGRLVGTYGPGWGDERRLREPRGVAILPDGKIVVADADANRVNVYSSDLASLAASFSLRDAWGAAAAPGGGVIVWDRPGTVRGRLRPDLSGIDEVPAGVLPGRLAHLAFDGAGNAFALEAESGRVSVVDSGFRRVLVQMGSEGAVERPERVVVDRDGNIYVVDGREGRTRVYRWDVRVPPLRGLSVTYEPGAALLQWESLDGDFIRAFELQGSGSEEGPFEPVGTTDAPRVRIAPEEGLPPVRYARVVPVLVTGAVGAPTRPVPLLNLDAAAALERGDHERSLDSALEALGLVVEGRVGATPAARVELVRIAARSGAEAGRLEEVIEVGERVAETTSGPALLRIRTLLARSELSLARPDSAAGQLLLAARAADAPGFFRDSAVVELSYAISRFLVDAGRAREGVSFLRRYAEAVPAELEGLGRAYADSAAVFDTRAKLGSGFEAWRQLDLERALEVFQSALAGGELSTEQEIIARQMLAVTEFSFGRRNAAADQFQRIYQTDPEFDIEEAAGKLERLYGVAPYNSAMRQFFRQQRP